MGEFIKLLPPLLVIFYLILFFLEMLFPGFVRDNFELNILLLAALLASGVAEIPNILASIASTRKYLSVRILAIILIPILVYISWISYPKLLRSFRSEASLPPPVPILDVVASEPQLEPTDWENLPSAGAPDGTIAVTVLNGSNEKGIADRYAKLLKSYGYGKITTGDAPSNNYQGATIQFRVEDEGQALIIKDLLHGDYSPIYAAPLAGPGHQVVVILGSKAL